jgi:hypothetical protein
LHQDRISFDTMTHCSWVTPTGPMLA